MCAAELTGARDRALLAHNQRLIEMFRANGGYRRLPEDPPLLLLTAVGRRSGLPRTSPLAYSTHGGAIHVFASNGGEGRHPAWFRNLQAHPLVEVDLGTRRLSARAEVLAGAERDAVLVAHAERHPELAEYQSRTARLIPVIRLVPTDDDPATIEGIP